MEVYKAIPCTWGKEGYELPPMVGEYFSEDVILFDEDGFAGEGFYDYEYGFWQGIKGEPTHWLKKVEIPEMTDEEIEKMANDYCGDETGQIRSTDALISNAVLLIAIYLLTSFYYVSFNIVDWKEAGRGVALCSYLGLCLLTFMPIIIENDK